MHVMPSPSEDKGKAPEAALSHLQDGYLLTPSEIAEARQFFQNNPNANYFPGKKFPVVKRDDGEILVLFAKHNELFIPPEELNNFKNKIDAEKDINPHGIYPLGVGVGGVVVAAQTLDGDWIASKFETFNPTYYNKMDIILKEQSGLRTQEGVYKGTATFNNPPLKTVMTAMKLGPGKDLNKEIVDTAGHNKLDPTQKLDLAFKAGSRTAVIPKQGIVLQDYKPNNIMASLESGELMLIDFGGADVLDENGNFEEPNAIATRGYQAPELEKGAFFVNKKVQSESTMAFAFGVTLAEIFTRGHLLDPQKNKFLPEGVDKKTAWQGFYKNLEQLPLPDDLSFRHVLQCFCDVLGDNPENIKNRDIIEREMSLIVGKLIHLDPNQRISISLATRELNVLKEYHALLNNNGISLAANDATSLLDHMNKVAKLNPNNAQLLDKIKALKAEIKNNNQEFVEFKQNRLAKRVELYLNKLETDSDLTSGHKDRLAKYVGQLKGLEPSSKDYQKKGNAIIKKIYAEKYRYEATITFNELYAQLQSLEKHVDKKDMQEANKQADKVIKLLSQKSFSKKDIKTLHKEMQEFRKSIVQTRLKASAEAQLKTSSVLQKTMKSLNKFEHTTDAYLIYKQSNSKNPSNIKSVAKSIQSHLKSFIGEKDNIASKASPVKAPEQIEQPPSQKSISESRKKGIIDYLLDYTYLDQRDILPDKRQAFLEDRVKKMAEYAKETDPLVKSLYQAIKAKQAGNPEAFKQHMAEFRVQLKQENSEIRIFCERKAGKIARLEAPSQGMYTHSVRNTTNSTVTPIASSQLTAAEIAKCKSEIAHARNQVKEVNLTTAANVFSYINDALSAPFVSVQIVQAVHEQTKHLWKDPDASPLAKLIKQKNEGLSPKSDESTKVSPKRPS